MAPTATKTAQPTQQGRRANASLIRALEDPKTRGVAYVFEHGNCVEYPFGGLTQAEILTLCGERSMTARAYGQQWDERMTAQVDRINRASPPGSQTQGQHANQGGDGGGGPTKTKKPLSAAARKNIAAAQKKRWAEEKARKQGQGATGHKKGAAA